MHLSGTRHTGHKAATGTQGRVTSIRLLGSTTWATTTVICGELGFMRQKHKIRWQHFSQNKGMLQWSVNFFLANQNAQDYLYPGPVLPPTSWWRPTRELKPARMQPHIQMSLKEVVSQNSGVSFEAAFSSRNRVGFAPEWIFNNI